MKSNSLVSTNNNNTFLGICCFRHSLKVNIKQVHLPRIVVRDSMTSTDPVSTRASSRGSWTNSFELLK